jgi:hypothetical protein
VNRPVNLVLLVSILICHVSWQRPPALNRQQVDSVLDVDGIPVEFRPSYDVFLDSSRQSDTSPYTYRYITYERGAYIPKSAEEIKFEKEQERWRSWRKPAGWILVVLMFLFARWGYKEIRRYHRGRLLVEDEENNIILHDMPGDDPHERRYIN